MATDTAKKLTLRNTGSRRIIVGPPAKSKGGAGGRLHLLGTSDDDKIRSQVPEGKAVVPGTSVTLEGAAADAVRGSKVLEAVKDRLGLRVA